MSGNDKRNWLVGVCLILLSFFTVAQSFYQQREVSSVAARTAYEDQQQRECLERVISNLTRVLQDRADLNDLIVESQNTFLVEASHATSSEDIKVAFRTFIENQNRIAKIKTEKPIPPYPNGRCTSR